MANNEKMAKYNKRTGAKYLDEQATKEGVFKLKSGMLVEILQESTKEDAKSPNQSDSCEVTYAGTLKDGTPFDAGTTSFAPNQVIKGWTEAMQLMVEGDKWKLYIPFDLAYGERGSPPVRILLLQPLQPLRMSSYIRLFTLLHLKHQKIPAFAPLVFEIEIHKVIKGGKSKESAREAFQKALSTGSEL